MKKQGVELYRFILTITICLHHFRLYSETTLPYGGGYLAVDFFFILSGFFLYERSQRESADSAEKLLKRTVTYAVGRYKRLFPQYMLALILSIMVYVYVIQENMNITCTGALIAKLFMFDGIYVHEQISVMPQGWYCSALWTGSILVYFLSARYKQKFTKNTALILAVGIYVILFLRYGHLNLYTQYGLGVTVGVFRGVAGLCLGCVLGNTVSEGGKLRVKSRWADVTIFLFFTVVMLYALLWNTAYNRSDFVIVFVFTAILYYLLSDNNISSFFNRYELFRLGRISYIMFLIHHPIAVMFEHYDWFRTCDWKISSMAYLGVVVICSYCLESWWQLGTVKK